jgi:hypothetical protein
LKAGIGDTLCATLTADGVDLVLADAYFGHQITVMRDVMSKRKPAFIELK